MDPFAEEEMTQDNSSAFINPFTFLFASLAAYGWYIVGAGIAAIYIISKLRPKLDKWREAQEDAEYHKNPDKVLARMEAIQLARERQQQMLLEASERAKQEQKEKEELKRQENIERLKKYGSTGGQRLGTDNDYLPLSGGASGSTYRAPKKSKCGGGGCGK